VFDHTTKNVPQEGVSRSKDGTVNPPTTASAEAAVRQPSAGSVDEGDARQGGDSSVIPVLSSSDTRCHADHVAVGANCRKAA
jgi:hypothetical protein